MKDLFRYVLMESGDMCVQIFHIGFGHRLVLIMQEWCAANLGTLHHVSFLHTIKDLMHA